MSFLKAMTSVALLAAAHAVPAQVVVVVANSSPLGVISREQVSSIYLGRSQKLPDGSRAVPVDNGSGALREEFADRYLHKSAAQVKSIWSRLIFSGSAAPVREVGDSMAVKSFVTRQPGAIGYIEASAVDASVKVVLSP